MFTIHDTRMTGCPRLAEVFTPDGAWATADALGIPRASALVLPAGEGHGGDYAAPIARLERREAAERAESIGMLFAGFGPETVASAISHHASSVTPVTSEAA